MTDLLNDIAADCPCTAELVFSEPVGCNSMPTVRFQASWYQSLQCTHCWLVMAFSCCTEKTKLSSIKRPCPRLVVQTNCTSLDFCNETYSMLTMDLLDMNHGTDSLTNLQMSAGKTQQCYSTV